MCQVNDYCSYVQSDGDGESQIVFSRLKKTLRGLLDAISENQAEEDRFDDYLWQQVWEQDLRQKRQLRQSA
jgi:hypothetical protein